MTGPKADPGGHRRHGVITFEPMRRRHLPAVLRTEHRAHPKPWTLGVFNSELSHGADRYYVVMKRDGRLVGYAGLMFVVDEAHVTNIAVSPELRRQGLGSLLLAHLVKQALERGCSSMTLEVRMSNLAAQALYRSFGFVAEGVRPNYYPETHEDGLVMWLHELASPVVAARLGSIGEAL